MSPITVAELLDRKETSAVEARRPWSVDRWGRLVAGLSLLTFLLLGVIHHPAWHLASFVVALNLVVTSVTDKCPLRDLLIRLGAKEREDLFLPGGLPRKMGRAHDTL